MVKQIISTIQVIGLVGALTACDEVRKENPTCAKNVEYKLDNRDALLKKTGDGTLRIIVTLAADSAKIELEKERSQYISLVQDRFIKSLSQEEGKIDGRMRHAPQLFMTVDTKMLQAIYKREDVCTIHEDEPQQFFQ